MGRLAISANLQGKLTSNFHRPNNIIRAVRKLKQKVEEKDLPLPRICPNKSVLDKILHKELEHERNYFPEWFESQGGEEGVKKSFDAAVKKKLCSLDIDTISKEGIMDNIYKEIS